MSRNVLEFQLKKMGKNIGSGDQEERGNNEVASSQKQEVY